MVVKIPLPEPSRTAGQNAPRQVPLLRRDCRGNSARYSGRRFNGFRECLCSPCGCWSSPLHAPLKQTLKPLQLSGFSASLYLYCVNKQSVAQTTRLGVKPKAEKCYRNCWCCNVAPRCDCNISSSLKDHGTVILDPKYTHSPKQKQQYGTRRSPV